MSASAQKRFSNHSGGVVQVRHATRYGAVPEALLEDSRLDLDSRAVAAWLAVKQDGWQILVGVLRARLVLGDQALLGKDRWQRIANELEAAGYLTRTKVNGHDGRWNWHITFTPVPENRTRAGLAGSGATSAGMPGAGAPVDGQPGHKVISRKVVPKKVIPTTTTNATVSPVEIVKTPERSSSLLEKQCAQELHFPDATSKERLELERLMLMCKFDFRQEVLDEIEGVRRAGGIKRGIVALAKALVDKVATGEFALSAGHLVQAQRDKRNRHAAARSVSIAPLKTLIPMSEKEIAKLPPNIAKRVREHAVTVTPG